MTLAVTSCVLAMPGPRHGARVHYSMAEEYDATRQLPVEGIVNACRFVNPQSFIEMDVTGPRRPDIALASGELVAVGMTPSSHM